MPTLRIFDKFDGLIETHEFNGSLKGWLQENLDDYHDSVRPPYSANLNGNSWPYAYHIDDLNDGDVVDLTIEPCDPLTIAYVVIAVVSAAYAYSVASNLPKGYQNSTEKGQSIYKANARANSIKPSGIVREVAGTYPVFPDLICPPHRKYIDHEEFILLMMSVSSGHMFLREKNIYIAETPITNYQGDYTLNIYDPSADVSGNVAHENWFESKEVLDLPLTTATSVIPGDWTATYAGSTITTYLDGALQAFPFPAGAIIEITAGSNQGVYSVVSVGSPDHTATLSTTTTGDANDAFTRSIVNITTSSRVVSTSDGLRFPPTRNQQVIDYSADINSPLASLTSVSPQETIEFLAFNGGVNWEGPFEVLPVNETARYIEVDVVFPGGLVTVDANGNTQNRSVELEIQYREVGATAWTRAVDASRSPNATLYEDNTYDERAYTVEIDLGSAIRPEFRFRRIFPESTDISTVDAVVVRRLKAKLETPTTYADVTTMALVLRGTNSLAVTAENKINIRGASRKLPTLQEIQDAAGGTPYDISASTTQTTSDYLVTDNAADLGATSINFTDTFPQTNGTDISVDFSPDGLRMLSYENGVLRSFTLNEAFNPRNGFTYNNYSLAAAATYPKNAIWADSGTKVVACTKQSDPSTNAVITQYDLSVAYDVSTATSVASFTSSSEITDLETFYMSDDGAKFWIGDGNGQKIEQYVCSTPWDMTTASRDSVGSPQDFKTLDVSPELNQSSPNATLVSFWLEDYSGVEPTKLWVLSSGGPLYSYTLSTPGDIETATNTSSSTIVQGGSGSKIHVSASYLHLAGSWLNAKESPNLFQSVCHTWLLDTVSDSRESSSIVRYAASALYDGLGSEVSDIVDWTAMGVLDTALEARGDDLNGEFVDETTLWEALRIIFAPGYSEPAMKEGKLIPIRIAAGTDYDHLYTPDFMLDDGLIIDDDHYDGSDPDGVDVEYLDEDSGEMEVVECRLSGDTGIHPKRIQAVGITNRTRAWRFGMRERRRIFYKPANYTFRTEMDGLNSEYGDSIAIASDIFSSQTGGVTAQSGDNLTLDFVPTFDTTTSPMPTYFAAFKKPEGDFSGLYTITMGSPNNIITIIDSPGLDFTPVTDASPASDGENTLVSIGTADEWGVRAIVRRISPEGADNVEILAEEYVSDVYSDDDSSPP